MCAADKMPVRVIKWRCMVVFALDGGKKTYLLRGQTCELEVDDGTCNLG